MSALSLPTAASDAAARLLNSPEIAPSRETFARIAKHLAYDGPARSEIDDSAWDLVRGALKFVAANVNERDDDQIDAVCQSLRSVDRPDAERLFYDFCAAANHPFAYEVWHGLERHPADVGEIFWLARVHGWAPACEDPTLQSRLEARRAEVLRADEEAYVARCAAQELSRFTPRIPDLSAPRPRWIVKGVLQEKSLVVLYGKWGTGKSSFAVDLGVAIARGAPWHGRKTQQGAVVYVASENAHGLRARLDALLRDQGITLADLGGRFLLIDGRPHLLKPDDVKELIAELKAFGPISGIVVDTFSRATAGSDENAVKEMMIAVENMQTIMNETGAAVLLIHHIGKDSARGARGSSALPAAADTEIVLERPDETANLRTASLGKQRDAADYVPLFNFELKTVELGRDEDGDVVSSAVVREIAPAPESTLAVVELKNTPMRRMVRGVLGDAQRAMPFTELFTKAAAKLAPPDPGERDRRRERIKQVYEGMVADKELHVDATGMVSLRNPAILFAPVPETMSKEQDKTQAEAT